MTTVVVGTAGHIDHGKSALVEALTGTNPDRLKEEQARGITIDLGFAHLRSGDVTVAIVDVPGHERFVRNMLAGATGLDAVVLVIAADESVMPQTREHFDICRLLGIETGLIALSKCDLADRDMRSVAALEARQLVKGSFLEGAPVVEVSAVTGEGMEAFRQELVRLANRAVRRPSAGLARLPIDRAFTMRGFGTVVTGTLVSGTVRVDDTLNLLPAGRTTRVRGLHVHGASVSEAHPSQRVAVNLGDLHVSELARGDTLVTPGWFETTQRVDARLHLLADAPPLKHGARVRVHHGTAEVMGRVLIARVLAADDSAMPPGQRSDVLMPAQEAHVRLRLEAPLVAARGDRFVLRRYSPVRTIAGGVILDPAPWRRALRQPATLAVLAELDAGQAADVLSSESAARTARAVVAGEGRRGLAFARLVPRLGLDPTTAGAIVDRLAADGEVLKAGDLLLSTSVCQSASDELLALVQRAQETDPAAGGLPREEARDKLGVDQRVLDAIVDQLRLSGRLDGRDRLLIPGRGPSFSADQLDQLQRVEEVGRNAGLRALDSRELEQALQLAPGDGERLGALLVRQKRLVRLGTLLFHPATLEGLKATVRTWRDASPDSEVRLDVSTFKARFDLSRKYAIPLLEYLDRERVTRRVGDARIVL